jgi:transcriptional regulator with XRE-family HTH domain
MPKRKKDEEMLKEMTIKRINHVPELCKKKGWSKSRFVREAMYHTPISDTTLEKAFSGETDLSLDTVEQLAKLFNVMKDEILESVW